MNDIQCMNYISKTDLENKGFTVGEINQNGYTEVLIGDIKGFVWFSTNKKQPNNDDYYINFIAEYSGRSFFRKLYENFEIHLLDEDYFQDLFVNYSKYTEKEIAHLEEMTKNKLFKQPKYSSPCPTFANDNNCTTTPKDTIHDDLFS